MAATIEFTRGITEVPTNVKVLKSKTGSRSSAVFRFEELNTDAQSIISMVMSDEEGEITCRELRAKFVDGQFKAIEVIYEMEAAEQWDRFMRFMDRFSTANEMSM
ncbi:MAG: photosystem II reaction center protein Psb28 [Synechococcaceae cyanobacterium SM2_3_1]|nr:photosystem II reaction center protein Psb28 [Synechococcaceae cyanobacterium SM2_3_1]